MHSVDILLKKQEEEIDKECNAKEGTGAERPYKEICIKKCGFFLPKCTYFDNINNAADNTEKNNTS